MKTAESETRTSSGTWKSRDLCAVAFLALSLLLSAPVRGPLLAENHDEDWSAHPTNEWVRQSPRPGVPTPRLKYEGSGDFDPVRERWIHFAGHDGIPQGFHLFTFDLKSGVWRQHFPNTSPPGVCCVDGSNVFDVANGRFVAFPGGSLGHGYQWSRSVKLKRSNVWLYDPAANTWTDMRPPPYKRPEKYSREVIGGLNSSATYDPDHEVTITFGGQGAGGPTNALFVYDAYSNQLEQRRPPTSPSRRDGAGLCWDSRRKMLVLFGSQYSDDERTWTYRFETNRWEGHELDPHPPGRKEGTYSTNPKMAYDAANGVCLCVVRRGEESGRPTGTLETWVLDSEEEMKWTRMEPAVVPDPSASRARNLGYWPEKNLFILESVAADKSGPQIWTYRYRPAPGRAGPPSPTGLRVVTESRRATLSWNPSAPAGVESDSIRYNVLRAEGGRLWEARFAKIASTQSETFRDEGLTAGAVYHYRVTAVNEAGEESPPSRTARTQPRVVLRPVVSVLAADRIEVSWRAHPDRDVAGYNVYRGLALVDAVRRGTQAAWRDNDPEYAEPVIVNVRDIIELERLNGELLEETAFTDTRIDLKRGKLSSPDYRCAVYAYVVRAVNRLGTESGPSPYALTIPSTPQHVLLREREGGEAEIRWAPNPEKGIAGYRLYKLGKSHWEIVRVNESPVPATTFRHAAGKSTTRYWVLAVDSLGQEGQPSSAVWYRHAFEGFFEGEWHQ